ncbi:MAG: tyrosine-type recombinase/integrase [Christensenellaceae bacterium]|jgi:site-specific recombinase XerD|nr:tyrosine-type recombinase/integrase [Christensenellaceae bacterium]
MKYHEERNVKNLQQLDREILKLPPFCHNFFIGISQITSPLTRLNYAKDLYIFFNFITAEIEYFVGKKFEDISPDDLNELTVGNLEIYQNHLTTYTLDGKLHTNGEQGKMRKMASLRSFFKYFYRRGEIIQNVLTKIDLPKIHDKEIVRLNNNEVSQILEISRQNLRDNMILTLFLLSGIRVSELVGLDYKDIDIKTGTFLVTRKGGKRSILYMGEQLKEKFIQYFDSQFETNDDKNDLQLNLPLFTKCKKRMSTRAIYDVVRKYAKIVAPLKKISPHKLRSTFGTNLYKATGDIYVVANVLGHSDVNTTRKHYAALTEDIRKKAADAVKV